MSMSLPNAEQIKSVIRWVLTLLFGGAVGAWLIKRGIAIDDNFINMAVGVAFGVASLVWGMFNHSQASAVQTAAAIVPISPSAQRAAGVTTPVPTSEATIQP